MTAKKLNLWQKLLEIKKQVPYLKKDKSSFQYKYNTPEQVLGTLNPLFNDFGILVKTEVITDGVKWERVTYKTKHGDKTETLYNVPMRITLINTDEPEERETYEWFGSGCNGEEKGYGSALTYGERYFFLKQSQIPTGEDDPDRFQNKYGEYDEPKKNGKTSTRPTAKASQSASVSGSTPVPDGAGVDYFKRLTELRLDFDKKMQTLYKKAPDKLKPEELSQLVHWIGRVVSNEESTKLTAYYEYISARAAFDRLTFENIGGDKVTGGQLIGLEKATDFLHIKIDKGEIIKQQKEGAAA